MGEGETMEQGVQFTEEIRPVRSREKTYASSSAAGGIYPMRSRSQGRRDAAPRKKRVSFEEADEDPGLRDDSDYKKRQVCPSI